MGQSLKLLVIDFYLESLNKSSEYQAEFFMHLVKYNESGFEYPFKQMLHPCILLKSKQFYAKEAMH